MRRHALFLSLAPAALVTVTAVAVILFLLHARSTTATAGAVGLGVSDGVVRSVFAIGVLIAAVVLAGAAMVATADAHATADRYAALRRSAARSQSELRALLGRLERGERPHPPATTRPVESTGDALDLLAHDLTLAHRSAEAAVIEAARLARGDTRGNEERVEVFANLARRLQSLVHREIELLDELENEVEDPDLLKGLFTVDHLATRTRRHAENLAVLGGAVSRRQWSLPVSMTEVLRSSVAEVEHYPRVKLVPPVEGTLRGHAVADVIHLLAELVENATTFSAPHTQVLLRTQHVTAGLAIEVEDRGLGMVGDDRQRMNALLADPQHVDVGELLRDGRIGLFVVSALARRHGIAVQLQSNIYGGTQAVLVLPSPLLGEQPGAAPETTVDPEPAIARYSDSAYQDSPYSDSGYPEAGYSDAGYPVASRADLAEPPVAHAPADGLSAERSAAAGRPAAEPLAAEVLAAEPLDNEPPAVHSTAPELMDNEPPAAHGVPRSQSWQQQQQQQQQRQQRQQPWPDPVEESGHPTEDAMSSPAVIAESELETTMALPLTAVDFVGASPSETRPRLPRRRRQQHLVPQLRDAPPASNVFDEPAQGHDPGLMAAFRRGTSLVDAGEDSDLSDTP